MLNVIILTVKLLVVNSATWEVMMLRYGPLLFFSVLLRITRKRKAKRPWKSGALTLCLIN